MAVRYGRGDVKSSYLSFLYCILIEQSLTYQTITPNAWCLFKIWATLYTMTYPLHLILIFQLI